jgi:hypothetical protein
MSTAIQTVPATYAVNTLAALNSISRVAQQANSSLFVPDVISTLSGSASAVPITYNSAGLFESLLQVADAAQGASGSTTALGDSANSADQGVARLLAIDPNSAAMGTGASTTATNVYDAAGMLQGLLPDSAVKVLGSLLSKELGPAAAANSASAAATAATGADAAMTLKSLLLANAVDLSAAATEAAGNGIASATIGAGTVGNTVSAATAAPAASTAAGSIAATPDTALSDATSPDAASGGNTAAATTNAGGTPDVTAASTGNFIPDSAAQALANSEGSFAYANAVSGLYMSAVIYRAQQTAAAQLNAPAGVQPLTAVPGIVDAYRKPTA